MREIAPPELIERADRCASVLARDLARRWTLAEDLTALGLHLGFSSHSHFTAAFQQAYGRAPSEFRQSVLRR